MRIGVGLFQYFAGKVGGTGEMIEKGLPRLLGLMGPDDRLVLFGTHENVEGLRRELNDPRVEGVEFSITGKGVTLLRVADLVLPGWGTRGILKRLSGLGLDVVWYPQQSLFPFGIWSGEGKRSRRGVPSIVTCVDLQHQHLPENFSPGERWGRYYKDRQMMRKGSRIVCISSATREDLLVCHGGHGADGGKVGVVYLGGGGAGLRPEARERGREGDAYLYFPANSYPHKNHVRLIRAFREFRRQHPEVKIGLVMTGQISAVLQRELDQCGAESGIRHEGFVSTGRKEELFRECAGVVFPSLFEGFGIPIIEAMSYGKRVLCHRLRVFEELVGEAVLYCDARSEEGIVEGLERMLVRPELLSPIDLGEYQRIVERLNWDRYAEEMWGEFRRLAGR